MEGKKLLQSVTLSNVLSFGREPQTLEFGPLNVLIGPNGSGKSNLIEILNLLRSLPRDLSLPFREGGGINEWIWKGVGERAWLRIESSWIQDPPGTLILHRLAIRASDYVPRVVEEFVDVTEAEASEPCAVYRNAVNDPVDNSHGIYIRDYYSDEMERVDDYRVTRDNSILSQRKDDGRYPEFSFLSNSYSKLLCYRKWVFGPGSPVRMPQRADLPGAFLEEDASNLGLVLNSLSLDRRAKIDLIENLKKVYEGAGDIRVGLHSGYVELLVEEDNGHFIPAVRLSDGTLRYLCLLAILCHPDPPPLVCIEEPELGLHPDLMPTIADLLVKASAKTQLIVTTHSAELVSALGDVPEAVVVCERGVDGTTLRRLEPDRLKTWLEKYTLGHLWGMGEIGGNRW